MKNYWFHEITEKYAPLSWIGRFSAITTYQVGWKEPIKDPRIAKLQWWKQQEVWLSCVIIYLRRKKNYVFNAKDPLSLAMDSIILLGDAHFSINNISRYRIKNNLQKDLHSLCQAGNPPTTLLLGDDLPKKIREAKESSKLSSHPLSQPPRCTGYENQKGGSQAKNNLLSQGNKHRTRYRPQQQNNRQ